MIFLFAAIVMEGLNRARTLLSGDLNVMQVMARESSEITSALDAW